jgi:hypothetical protein
MSHCEQLRRFITVGERVVDDAGDESRGAWLLLEGQQDALWHPPEARPGPATASTVILWRSRGHGRAGVSIKARVDTAVFDRVIIRPAVGPRRGRENGANGARNTGSSTCASTASSAASSIASQSDSRATAVAAARPPARPPPVPASIAWS